MCLDASQHIPGIDMQAWDIAITASGPVLMEVNIGGDYTIRARATDTSGQRQPETAFWNALGYGNNGVQEHAVAVRVNG